jgi:DNA-binding MarR family transcriptional regulator
VINRLEHMGLADRIPDQNDGRSSWVRLTGTGITVAERTAHAWAAAQDRFFFGLSPRLARQAADTLRAVLLAVGDREIAAAASHPRSRSVARTTTAR